MDTFAVLMHLASKRTYEIFGSTWNSVSNIYYICFIRQIALNDEIDAFVGAFKLRLDLTNLDKYLTYFSMVKDFQVSTIQTESFSGYNMYKDSLVKYRSRFLITTFLFVTKKAWTLYTCFTICYFLLLIRCTIILYCFAIHSITSTSGSLSNVCGYVLALAVRLLGISYLLVEDGIH